MNYEETKRILGEQRISQELWDNTLGPIIKGSDSLYRIVVHAYFSGMIAGKQQERARRAQR